MRIMETLGPAVLVVVLATIPRALLAQTPTIAAAQLPEPGRWNVDWGDRECVLAHRGAQEPHPVFALSTVPGTRRWSVRVIAPRFSYGVGGLRITFQPGGATADGTRYVESTEGGRGLVVNQLSDAVPDIVAAAQTVTLSQGSRPLLEIPLPRASEAVTALRECVNNALRGWGIDPIAFAAVRTPPEGSPAAVVSDGDYPAEAIRRHQQGTSLVRLRLDETGRVIGCRPLVSSGYEILDLQTCAVFGQRLRMTPARDAEGRPVQTMMVTQLRWVLPD